MSIISGILIDSKTLSRIADKVRVTDFYCDDLRVIYKTILNVANSGKAVDYITVLNALSASSDIPYEQNELSKILITCCQIIPSLSNIEYYADIVNKSAIARTMEQITEKLKVENMILWVHKMNNIHNRSTEIVNEQVIYNQEKDTTYGKNP